MLTLVVAAVSVPALTMAHGGGDPRGVFPCPDPLTDWANCHVASLPDDPTVSSIAAGSLRTMDSVTPTSANPSRLCWVGRYEDRGNPAVGNESFQIRVFAADGIGFPDLLAGPIFTRTFHQGGAAGVDLLELSCLPGQACPGTTQPPAGGHFIYTASVSGGFPMNAMGCYWVEIANVGSAQAGTPWLWTASQAGTDLQSLQAPGGEYTLFSRISYDRALCVSGGVDPFAGFCILHPGKPPCFFFGANGQPHDGATTAGQPSSTPGSPSDPNFAPVLWAENFQLDDALPIEGICFDGFWTCAGSCEAPAVPVFDLVYYDDSGGIPGPPIATFRTGEGGASLDGDGNDWTHISHPAVPVEAGRCYWMSISRVQGFASESYLAWNWRRTTAPTVGDGLVAAQEAGQWSRRILASGGSAAASHFVFGLSAGSAQRPSCTDCNANGTPDAFEIAANPLLDCFTPPVGGPFIMGGPDAYLDGCQCIGNWNRDGAVNSTDISHFLTSWLAALNAGTPDADADCSGLTNSTDISYFLTRWIEAVTTTPVPGCP